MTQCWPGGATLAVNLRHDLLQQVPVLRGGEDQQGELDGVGGGLRPGSKQIPLEEKQLAPGEASRLVATSLDLLEIEVSQTVGRVPLRQVSLSVPGDLLVYCCLSLLTSSKHQSVQSVIITGGLNTHLMKSKFLLKLGTNLSQGRKFTGLRAPSLSAPSLLSF